MTPIHVTIVTQDVCDPAPGVVLAGVTAADRKEANPETDVAGAAIGTDDCLFEVRARRAGGRGGRIDTALYTVTDPSGNSATAAATVRVAASRRR